MVHIKVGGKRTAPLLDTTGRVVSVQITTVRVGKKKEERSNFVEATVDIAPGLWVRAGDGGVLNSAPNGLYEHLYY